MDSKKVKYYEEHAGGPANMIGENCPPGKEFIFKMPNGKVVGRAKNVHELANLVKNSPQEAVLFHAKGKHFEPWLFMLGKKAIASELNRLQVEEKTIRDDILRTLQKI